MFKFFHFGKTPPQYITPPFVKSAGTGLLFNGLLCVLFSVAIFVNPDLLAFLIATFLLIIGVMLLTSWWKLKQMTDGPRQ